MKYRQIIYYLPLVFFLFSCDSEMNKEVNTYCSCLKTVYGKKGDLKNVSKCFDIHDSIVNLHIKDPAYVTEINKKMKSCADEWIH